MFKEKYFKSHGSISELDKQHQQRGTKFTDRNSLALKPKNYNCTVQQITFKWIEWKWNTNFSQISLYIWNHIPLCWKYPKDPFNTVCCKPTQTMIQSGIHDGIRSHRMGIIRSSNTFHSCIPANKHEAIFQDQVHPILFPGDVLL